MSHFSGSYAEEDVEILLKTIQMPSTSIQLKEAAIQSKTQHYSEMITFEELPSPEYWKLFKSAFMTQRTQFALDCYRLASLIHASRTGELVLVSLARAGTPIGVILKRILAAKFQREVKHYSISILRDRGLDLNAMRTICSRHEATSIVFIDGWTSKGVISNELRKAITQLNSQLSLDVSSDLYVLADISGTAAVAATELDYLIPSSILNSVVSGLISRSILNTKYLRETDYHGCLYYAQFESSDISQKFVDMTVEHLNHLFRQSEYLSLLTARPQNFGGLAATRDRSRQFLIQMMERFQITDPNLIKPGIGESTRVMLRRVPETLILRHSSLSGVQHLIRLADEKHVPILIESELPYAATAIIARRSLV
jgi:hypothetical protein